MLSDCDPAARVGLKVAVGVNPHVLAIRAAADSAHVLARRQTLDMQRGTLAEVVRNEQICAIIKIEARQRQL